MKKRFIITFILSLLVFTLIYTTIWNTFASNDKALAQEDDHTETIEDEIDVSDETEDKLNEKNEIVFLMMGIDAPDVKKSKGTHTDTMILVRANFDDGSLNMLSIPRDTRVAVKGKLDKINHAHAFGGTALTMNTVRDFLGIDIDYYVKVDYRAVKGVVDAIGGVDIYVPRRMEYYDPTVDFRVDLYEGQQTLDGDKSIQFLRWRKNNSLTAGYADGDIGRIKTQQYFLEELIKQTLQPKNLFKLPKIAEMYFDYVDTNIPMKVILKGVGMASSLDVDKVRMETVPGVGEYIGNISYYIYDSYATEELVKDMFRDYLLD